MTDCEIINDDPDLKKKEDAFITMCIEFFDKFCTSLKRTFTSAENVGEKFTVTISFVRTVLNDYEGGVVLFTISSEDLMVCDNFIFRDLFDNYSESGYFHEYKFSYKSAGEIYLRNI